MNWYFQRWRVLNETWHSNIVTLKSCSQLKLVDFYLLQITANSLWVLWSLPPKENPAWAAEVVISTSLFS